MTEPYHVLVLDPATSTGYSVVKISEEGDDVIGNVIAYGHIDVSLESQYQGDHCLDLMRQVKDLMRLYHIKKVAREDYFFSKRTATGSNVNAAFRTALDILCRRHKIHYTILNITEWKKYVCGRCRPTPEQSRKWGKEPAKKLYVQEALWNRFGFRFPNHSISEKTGKPISFRLDVIDAVAQSVYYSMYYLGVTKMVMSVECPDDVEMKTNKKCFIYPKCE
jgi:Holliday junction resolvasome RuvABC endonuclease subunit